MPPAFPVDEFNARVPRLRKLMRAIRVDVCVVTSPENVAYLSGHATPGYYSYQALIVPIESEPMLLLRESEVINARETSFLEDVFPYSDGADPISVRRKRSVRVRRSPSWVSRNHHGICPLDNTAALRKWCDLTQSWRWTRAWATSG